MGRVINIIGIMVMMHIALALVFAADIPGTGFYTYVNGGLEGWGDAEIWNFLKLDILAVISGAGIVAGLYLIRNDFAVYASVAVAFFTFGSSYVTLYQTLAGETFFGGSTLMLSIIIAPILILWGMLLLEFARGRD